MNQNKTQEISKASFRESLEDPENPPRKVDKALLTFLLKDSGWRALRVFFIVGGIRSGVNVLLKFLSHVRKKKPFQKDLLEAFIGKEVRGSCLFLGGFVFTWKLLSRILPIYHQKRTRLTDFLAGFIAGIFILAERSDRQVSFSQQLSVSFMVQQAQIPHSILEVNRRVIARQEIDVEAFTDLLRGMKATPNNIKAISNLSPVPGALPCVAYHPSFDSCTMTFFAKFSKVMKMILPVYASLTFLPAIFLRFPLFKASPKEILLKCTLGSIRSSAFLATLVSVYQLAICQIRSVGGIIGAKDHRSIYFLAALVSSIPAILIEKPSRRTELSLYAIPKAIDSLYRILYSKKWMFGIPHFEAFMFMVASGATMLYYQCEPEILSPLLRWVLDKLVGLRNTKPTILNGNENTEKRHDVNEGKR